MPERKYPLTKVINGDYLLPSNDGHTIWRIRRAGSIWSLWRWHERVNPGDVVDTYSWSRWEHWDGFFRRRSEAIRAALNAGDRRA